MAPTVWSVVRDILTANIGLTADEVITKAKAKGLKVPDAVIRGTVHTVRKKLKQKAAASAPKPVPVAARTTTAPGKPASLPVSPVVRAILSADLDLPADAAIAQAKAKGVTASDESIRNLVHNIRSELKKAGAKWLTAPKEPATVSKSVAEPKPAPAPAAVVPAPALSTGLANVLSNVALVNAAVAASGGVEQARQVAEAVRACGGADQFAQYLDLVAGIRTN
ncbi:hypothetical protein J0H58_04845 [bacterium]|nr:hypothetical protein [bacterium]